MIVLSLVMLFGIVLMVLACSPPLCYTDEGPFLFWPGLILLVGAAIVMGWD